MRKKTKKYQINLENEFKEDEDIELYTKDIFIVNNEQSAILRSGFYPLYLLIIDIARERMSQLKQHAEDFGFKPVKFETDCLYVEPINEAQFDEFISKRWVCYISIHWCLVLQDVF